MEEAEIRQWAFMQVIALHSIGGKIGPKDGTLIEQAKALSDWVATGEEPANGNAA